MKILIDGDSCSVIGKTIAIAKKHHTPVHIYCDTKRDITSQYAKVHIVDCGRDSVDFAIINHCNPRDIVVTNDGGLAAMVLSKNGYAINGHGYEYTDYNIVNFLNTRYFRNQNYAKNSNKKKRKTHRQLRCIKNPIIYTNYFDLLDSIILRSKNKNKEERELCIN